LAPKQFTALPRVEYLVGSVPHTHDCCAGGGGKGSGGLAAGGGESAIAGGAAGGNRGFIVIAAGPKAVTSVISALEQSCAQVVGATCVPANWPPVRMNVVMLAVVSIGVSDHVPVATPTNALFKSMVTWFPVTTAVPARAKKPTDADTA